MALSIPENPARWIAGLEQPSWDAYFMGMVFLVAMRSADRETKQGCLIVDSATNRVMSTGYNGHPAGAVDYWEPGDEGHRQRSLPTLRPDKYPFIVHADQNAAAQAMGTSGSATCYLPMPPCERCLQDLNQLRLRGIHVARIVYLEHRDFPDTVRLLRHLPHIRMEQYDGPHPAEVLLNAARYATLRTTVGKELSRDSTKTYCRA